MRGGRYFGFPRPSNWICTGSQIMFGRIPFLIGRASDPLTVNVTVCVVGISIVYLKFLTRTAPGINRMPSHQEAQSVAPPRLRESLQNLLAAFKVRLAGQFRTLVSQGHDSVPRS